MTKPTRAAMLRAAMTTTHSALGQSLVIDLHQCDRLRIADREIVKTVMVNAATESGATVVDAHFHQFAPQGISGVVVITESHFAIHTWPEHAFAAVDIFTCGHSVDLHMAVALIKRDLGARSAAVTHHAERGMVTPPALTDQTTVIITVHGCRDATQDAAERFIAGLSDLANAQGVTHVVPSGFSFLGEKLSVSGQFNQRNVTISVMCPEALAPPVLAASAMKAFAGAGFRFQTVQ